MTLILAFFASLISRFICSLTESLKMLQSIVDTLRRDIRATVKFAEFNYLWRKSQFNNESITGIFKRTVERHPNKIAIKFQKEEWTFRELDEFSNRIANCFNALGFKAGDEIALLMNNKPEYIGIWVGLAKAGIITAFVNTNNRMDSLVNSFTAFNCKAVIYDIQYSEAISDIIDMLPLQYSSMKYFVYSQEKNNNYNLKFSSKPLYQLLKNYSKTSLDLNHKRNFGDNLCYIFTSGTTGGKPKAAILTDARTILGAHGHTTGFRFKSDDNFYISLPLYHAFSGIMGAGVLLIYGNTITIAEKFSASKFWDDCIKYDCTVALYIGETCRYLLSQPNKPEDQKHSIRMMYGLGLRKEYWSEFVARFGIKRVAELYGASESNIYLLNIDNREGSCGFLPYYYGFLLRLLYPAVIIKVDPITLEPARNSKGLCSLIKPGEVGVIVGRHDKNSPVKDFKGYTSSEETKKKLIYNVLTNGDCCFISGDLLEMDKFGYLYFKDRTGDTFRWKGENVSTTDVESVIQNYLYLTDSVVFGVKVGKCDGRAGMAVINGQNKKINFQKLAQQLIQRLPSYAVPLFIRITDSVELTGSYKLIKYNMREIGFNPNLTNDKIYFLDRNSNNYIPLDSKLYDMIESGQIRL